MAKEKENKEDFFRITERAHSLKQQNWVDWSHTQTRQTPQTTFVCPV